MTSIADYYHQKMNVRVALGDAEQLKITEMLGFDGEYLTGHLKGKF